MVDVRKNGRHKTVTPKAAIVANRIAEAVKILDASCDAMASGRPVGNQLSTLFAARQSALGVVGYDPRRDLNAICGYPTDPQVELYSDLFERDAIANRAVTVFPDESWAENPELFEDPNEVTETPWEKAWTDLLFQVPVYGALRQVDINAGIGQFGVLVMGFDDGKSLEEPVLGENLIRDNRRKPVSLKWLQTFDEFSIIIQSFIDNPSSPMHGMPEYYQIDRTRQQLASSSQLPPQELLPLKIHWSRCIHVITSQRRSSEVFGIPTLKPVLNRILDLQKEYGGSAEMLWQGGFMGLSIESLPDVDVDSLDDADLDSIKQQIQAYMNSQQRYIALSGMTAKPLSPQVSDPSKHIEVQLQAICAQLKVPLSVFLGSELGKIAGQQSMLNWNRRIKARQTKVLEPYLVKPFVDRLMLVGALPQVERYYVSWTDLNAVSDKDKAEVSMKKAQALTQYATSGAETICPPLEFWTVVMGQPLRTAEAIVEAAKKGKGKMTEKAWAKNKQADGPPKSPQNQAKGNSRNGLGGGRTRSRPKSRSGRRPVVNTEPRPVIVGGQGKRNAAFTRRKVVEVT